MRIGCTRCSLASLGCEVLRINETNIGDVIQSRSTSHLVSHVIYNKQYDADEMARTLSSVGASVRLNSIRDTI
jgi:hypothetical protein